MEQKFTCNRVLSELKIGKKNISRQKYRSENHSRVAKYLSMSIDVSSMIVSAGIEVNLVESDQSYNKTEHFL